MAERGMNQKQLAAHRAKLKRSVRGDLAPGDRGIQLQDTRAYQRARDMHEGVQDAEPRSERRGLTRDELRQCRKQRGAARRT